MFLEIATIDYSPTKVFPIRIGIYFGIFHRFIMEILPRFSTNRLLFLLSILFLTSSSMDAAEILFKNGEAYIVREISEREGNLFVIWKEKQYRIPKSEIQRVDPNKLGPDTSYVYSTVQLADGTSLRGIVVENGNGKLVLRTDLGFVELDSSKIVGSSSATFPDAKPDLSDSYLVKTSSSGGLWRGGIQISGNASLGPWTGIFPSLFGLGGFAERKSQRKGEFFGVQTDFSLGQSSYGRISIWSHHLYYGKSFGESAPYILLGLGADSISWSQDDRSRSGTDPSLHVEFGWSWDRPDQSLVRVGLQSQCLLESDTGYCRAGLKFSWGIYL